MVPEGKLEREVEGHKFGCYCFEELDPVHTEYMEEMGEMKLCESENVMEVQIPLKPEGNTEV